MNATLERPAKVVYGPGAEGESKPVKSTTYHIRIQFTFAVTEELAEDLRDVAIVDARRNEPSKPINEVFVDLGIGDCIQSK